MHILTELNIQIGPVLDAAVKTHFEDTGVKVVALALPVWQFTKLRTEADFQPSGFEPVTAGEWKGIKVFRGINLWRALMKEHGSLSYDIPVIKE